MTSDSEFDLPKGVKSVSRETQQRLKQYFDLLIQWQSSINLISPATVDQAWQRHFIDSLQIMDVVGEAETVVDIGSGAGFPGLVVAVLMAERGSGRVHLVESNGKKCAFMNAVIRATGLKDAGVQVEVVNNRIEKALPSVPRPDVVTARALASLNDLLTLTETFLANGSVGVFPKGRGHEEEMKVAQGNWQFSCNLTKSVLEDDSVILKISELRPR